jgi:hypothetical protein
MYTANTRLRRFIMLEAPTDLGEIEDLRKIALRKVGTSFKNPSWWRELWRELRNDYQMSLPIYLYYSGLAVFLYAFLDSVNP